MEGRLYHHVHEIIEYVRTEWNVIYSVPGMNHWLHRNGFSYKKPKGHPYKLDKAAQAFKDKANELNIKLFSLPPYSPNLNPIERLWKVMNEVVRNNLLFKSAKDFRYSITEFFEITLSRIGASFTSRINDKFHVV